MKVLIIGSGVAGSEAGTYLGHHATEPLEVVEVECEPGRRFGGWAFQSFPDTETTNLALRKMYLGRDPEEISRWFDDPEVRASWPEAYREVRFSVDRPVPRALVQRYIEWRRSQVHNPLVTYSHVSGEAMRVRQRCHDAVSVELRSGRVLEADALIMASGSIAVKVPPYLEAWRDHERVVIDPLVLEGHQRRQSIPPDARVLILGTGLTGEEQANILYRRGHEALTLLSRNGHRHYTYDQDQHNQPLSLDHAPDLMHAETPEEFDQGLSDFYTRFLTQGHSREDILAALRPLWGDVRANLGGCYQTAQVLRRFRRSLAVNSIGVSHEVAAQLEQAEADGALRVVRGHIHDITEDRGSFHVKYDPDGPDSGEELRTLEVDWIVNAVGRNIIRHPIWEGLLRDGLAKKHAGIGVRVSEDGQLMDADGDASDVIWVVGMARAGDHALRHGFLGNTAFNVPQVREHLYDTMDAMLGRPCPTHTNRLEEVLFKITHHGRDARLVHGDETPLIWAVSEGYSEIALALVEAGASLDARNSRGNTALIRAACEGRLALARALVSAGADLDVQNEDGYTAVILARRRGHSHIVEFLLEAGAQTHHTTRWGTSFTDPGSSPKSPLLGPRDEHLEADILHTLGA